MQSKANSWRPTCITLPKIFNTTSKLRNDFSISDSCIQYLTIDYLILIDLVLLRGADLFVEPHRVCVCTSLIR